MPNFKATEKNAPATAGGKPDDGPPVCPLEYLPHKHDGIALQNYFFRHQTHTLHDVIRPGYFNSVRETLAQQIAANAEILIMCVLGKREDGLTVVNLHVSDARRDPVFDVMVAYSKATKFTPVRHDGSARGDEISKAAKPAKAA